jgi:hypothetical protein
MAGPDGMIAGEHGMDLVRMNVETGKGNSKVRGAEIEREQEAARVFDMLSHGEGWRHAVKANPKALLWCKCQSIIYLRRVAKQC